jgi:hypothetical protein
MRPLLFVIVLVACDSASEPPPLTAHEQQLLGCWEGQQGTKTVQFQFHADRTVDTRIKGGTWYTGTFTLVGDALTYDFGEEPPTYRIELTATELRYVEPAFTFARTSCPAT